MSFGSQIRGLVICFAKRYVEYPRSTTQRIPNSPPRMGSKVSMLIPPTVPRSDVKIREPHAAQPKPIAPVKIPDTPITVPPPNTPLVRTRWTMRVALMPAKRAIAIVYEAERSVKFVVIEGIRLIGSANLSPSATDGSVHTENRRRRFGNHTAKTNASVAIVHPTTIERAFASTMEMARICALRILPCKLDE